MAVDLNKLADKMRKQEPVGVNRSGLVTPTNPGNDGTRPSSRGNTTLEPKRFFLIS